VTKLQHASTIEKREIAMNKNPRTFLFPLAVVAVTLAPALASADYLLKERFNYANGNLAGQGGWTAHSGAGTGPIQVNGGAAVATPTTGAEDVNTTFTAQALGAKTYSCFTMTVTAYTAGGSDYFAHLKDTGTTLFRSRVFISPAAGGGDFRVGIAVTSSGTSPTINWPTDLSLNTPYRIVHSFDDATGTSDLWVDPVDENSPKITSGPFAAATGVAISSFAIRQGTGATGAIRIDDVVIDDTFISSVGKPVPSLSQWGMMLLGMFLIVSGAAVVIRRRRGLAA
jgi:hypothetical protein